MYAEIAFLESLSPSHTRQSRRAATVKQGPSRPHLGPRELVRLARLPGGPLFVLAGDSLVRHGHPFYDLYAVCSGLIEARVTNAINYVRILGQYRAGDIIGLDALLRGNYPADFVALESSTVCAIPLSAVDDYLTQAQMRR